MEVLKGDENKKSQGEFVYTSQGTAVEQGFSHVSKYWYPKTMSYDEAAKQVIAQRENREDIEFDAKHVSFVPDAKGFYIKIADRFFTPSEWSARQLCNWFHVPQTMLTHYLQDDSVDAGDVELVVRAFKNGQRKVFGEKGKTLLFRTYKDGTLRGVMSEKYSTIDNIWYIELMKKYVPGGRCSHWRGDADTIYGNILIPDTIREETDSDYGGGISVSNSEIGKRILSQFPWLFRAICMNGNIWGRTNGVKVVKRHIGVKLEELAEQIRLNIHAQIPLISTALPMLMETHKLKAESKVHNLFAAIAKRNNLNNAVAQACFQKWTDHSNEKSAFGVIDGLTRAGQEFDNDVWVTCDEIAGEITSGGLAYWNRLNDYAKSLTDKEVLKTYGISA